MTTKHTKDIETLTHNNTQLQTQLSDITEILEARKQEINALRAKRRANSSQETTKLQLEVSGLKLLVNNLKSENTKLKTKARISYYKNDSKLEKECTAMMVDNLKSQIDSKNDEIVHLRKQLDKNSRDGHTCWA